MMRDVNGVRASLAMAGQMGRGKDNQMAHIGTGEVMLPPEIIDNYPQVMPHIIKAFREAGLDWRRYMAGTPQNSVNPKTGAKEFLNAGSVAGASEGMDTGQDRNPGGTQGDKNSPMNSNVGGQEYGPGGYKPVGGIEPSSYTGGNVANTGPDFNPNDLGKATAAFGPAGVLGYGLAKAGQHLFEGPGYTPPGGMTEQNISNSYNRDNSASGLSTPQPTGQMEKNVYSPPAQIEPPSYLEFSPSMTDLQRRAQIATYGLNASDPMYQSQEVQDYYKNLLANSLSGATDLSGLLPIERQYLEQVLGIRLSDLNSLRAALGGSQGIPNANSVSPLSGVLGPTGL